mgnify:CR=1 FL=1
MRCHSCACSGFDAFRRIAASECVCSSAADARDVGASRWQAVELGPDLARMRRQQQDTAADLIASAIECVTNKHGEARVVPQLQRARPASCAASARRGRRTARPSAGCRAPSPCRARSATTLLHAARQRVRIGCRRTWSRLHLAIVVARLVLRQPCRRKPSARDQRKHARSLAPCRQGSSWSNSWNTIIRSGPGCADASPFSWISPSTGRR